MPNLSVFIGICNALKVSPDYLLQDVLVENEITRIKELAELWESASLSQQEIVSTMIQSVLEYLSTAN